MASKNAKPTANKPAKAAAKATSGMDVIATQRGYYGGAIRDPGDRFAIADRKAFSKEWMKPARAGDIGDNEIEDAAAAHAGVVGTSKVREMVEKGEIEGYGKTARRKGRAEESDTSRTADSNVDDSDTVDDEPVETDD